MSKSSAKATTKRASAARGNQGKPGSAARPRRRAAAREIRSARQKGSGRRWWMIGAGLIVVFAVAVLYVVYQSAQHKPGSAAAGGGPVGSGFQHAVGQPGPGAVAVGFTLDSSAGGQVSLADYRGRNVLLYFQEGLSCQPCWDQIRDLEQNQPALRAAGVDAVVSITTDPVNLITQKMADQKLTTPVLSDPTMRISRAYTANQYGMMGEMRDGHSFILVGPDGKIRWRADYGGAPDYTMYLPTQKMLADLTAERTQ